MDIKGMKKITIDAGKSVVNEIKHIQRLKSDLYSFLFNTDKIPECVCKWNIQRVLTPEIYKILGALNKLEGMYE